MSKSFGGRARAERGRGLVGRPATRHDRLALPLRGGPSSIAPGERRGGGGPGHAIGPARDPGGGGRSWEAVTGRRVTQVIGRAGRRVLGCTPSGSAGTPAHRVPSVRPRPARPADGG